ncbi:hypothetical protein AWC38_SpisGene8659 [Stylophora pistillata]|uniref:Uncharacterized protein n=1 Tax=Stylophora pistillata TaxID=50429 RepID=A0A2B4SC94_STYPI|nr:hypothetical protein AWC38_SpisGene8659 [Stylophora pistillata]
MALSFRNLHSFHSNATKTKCCIVVKPEKEGSAKDVFKSTAINITSEGHKHLGAMIGSQEYRKEYVDEKTSQRKRDEDVKERVKSVYERAPLKTKQALDLATEKGSSVWLTVLPLQEQGYNLEKREFRDAIKLRYDWQFEDIPSKCACGDVFTVDHAMVCKKGGFIIQRHNELRDLEAEFLGIVCKDVELESQLQDTTGEQLNSGSNMVQDARLDIHARGFWEHNRSAFFHIRVCHPNAESYRNLKPQQIYRMHENEKKRSYSRHVLYIEHGSFTPFVFTSTGGMGQERLRYHSRLAELIAEKKGENYSKTISWIRAKTSFALLRSALICLRGSRTIRRPKLDFTNVDLDIQSSEAAIC